MTSLVFTGGHHTSALPVALELKTTGWQIWWCGHRYSMWGDLADSAEYLEVTAAGIPFYNLQAGKLYRTFHPLKLIRLPWGFIQAFFFLLELKPRGIVSFGGFLAAPVVFAGWILGIPSITHEQTVVSGWANRLVALFAQKIAITWPQSAKFFPASKTILTGLPLRPEILIPPPPSAASNVLYITGGKQGSHAINQAVFSLLPKLVQDFTQIIHQTGSSSLHSDYQKASGLSRQYSNYSCFGFDSQLGISALHQASLVIGRAGAHTVYELAVLGKPAVLIPLPGTSHSEQAQNAQFLADHHQAIILPQSQLSPQSLTQAIAAAVSLKPRPLSLPTDGLDKLVQLIKLTFS